jgi:hypothetical protein
MIYFHQPMLNPSNHIDLAAPTSQNLDPCLCEDDPFGLFKKLDLFQTTGLPPTTNDRN